MRRLSSIGIAALFLSLVLLAGCGQKGPLYSPNDEGAIEEYDPAGDYAEPGSGIDSDELDSDTDRKERR